jgi:hypothetical protein
MKKFTKLALISSMAISANVMAMQAMDDSALSATTGQDGLNIGIGISKIEINKLFIHDNDGLAGGYKELQADGVTLVDKTAAAGAIYIKGNGISEKDKDGNETNLVINKGIVIGANYDENGKYLLQSRNLADLVIDSDAGDGNPFINIAAKVSGLDIHIGEIGVVASAAKPAANAANIQRGSTGKENAILSGLSIKTGQMTANIQLGAAPQGAMIKLNTTMMGGLEIKNLGILDNSTLDKVVVPAALSPTQADIVTTKAGEIFIESIKVTDTNSKNLTLNQNINVFGESAANKGFIRIVSTSGAHDTYVSGIHLGSRGAASIGDVEVQGMQTYYSPSQGTYNPGAIITIAGH